MDLHSIQDLKRLEDQIFQYKPNIKSAKMKKYVCNRLRSQLLHSKAVVKIQRMDAECESLMVSLKQRLMFLQDILKPKSKEVNVLESQEVSREESEVTLNLSLESSDDEALSILKRKRRKDGSLCNIYEDEVNTTLTQQSDTYLPLALRRKPGERRLSYKAYTSASTSHSNKHDQIVTTSGVTFQREDMLLEDDEEDSTPTLHIKIPSLHRGNVHYIVLDSLNFARKVFDYRAKEVRKQQQQQITSHNSKTNRKRLNNLHTPVLPQFTQQEQELEEIIQDVMADACNDETLQATSALESINKNLIDNYDLAEKDTIMNFSQSSQEISCSQNSNVIETVDCTSGGNIICKKSRKNKRSFGNQKNEPPKKRGRKPKKNKDSDNGHLQPQPPTKSNLAQYVEFFSNDCEFLPGSSTPAASSTRSQPLVSSTTHNFEVVDQLLLQRDQHISQQPITYYIDGDWANGGPCQLVATNGMTVDGRQLNQEDFINCSSNSSNFGNNVVAAVLENTNKNQNKNHHEWHEMHHQPVVQNSLPIINIQIPPLPIYTTNSYTPPPAHIHKEVVDLSVKSKNDVNDNSNETLNVQQSNKNFESLRFSDDDDCLPLDLSVHTVLKEKLLENNSVTIDSQDEEFIRCLIAQSDFDYATEELKTKNRTENSTHNRLNDNSLKTALDMPLLDFDGEDLTHLAESTVTRNKIICNESENNEDSNYVSMTAMDSSIENNLNFSQQSAAEIFNKLLDICPDNNFLNDVNNELPLNGDINDIIFDQARVGNSTICEVENLTAQKDQLEKGNTEIYNMSSEDMEKPSTEKPSSNFACLDSSNTIDMSLNSKFTDGSESNELQHSSDFAQKIILINKNALQFTTKNKDVTETTNANAISGSNNGDTDDTSNSNSLIKNEENPNNKSIDVNNKCLSCTFLADNDKNNSAENTITNNTTDKELNIVHKENEEFLINKNALQFTTKNKDVTETTNANAISESNSGDTDGTSDSTSLIKNEENANNKSVDVNNKCLSYTILADNDKNNNAETNNTTDEELVTVHKEKKEISLKYSHDKSKENVVFSVAKITLSEYDNLYNTDSDFSSGKSCDLSELQPTASANNMKCLYSFTYQSLSSKDNSENDKEDSNSYKNENNSENNKEDSNVYNDEKIQLKNDDKSIDRELVDVSKNLECAKVENEKDKIEDAISSKTSNITNENLTLLELESKLEDSLLDLGEDFDDALSLATSCFDSPNVERFEDSVVDMDTTRTTQPSQDLPHYSCPNTSQIREYKVFKIPKLSASTESRSIMAQDEPISSVGKTALPINIEKLTRTVKNDLAELNFNCNSVTKNSDYENETTVDNLILKVFGITCLPYLVDKCIGLPHCRLSHQYNSADEAYRYLNSLEKIHANIAYRIMYNHLKLFKSYFHIFCTYYTNKNDRVKLLNMVNDCERYPEQAEFIIAVYEGLVECGLNRVNACRLILKRIREENISASVVESMVTIIIKSDWTMFTDFIEKYTQDMYQFNFRISILEQMAPAILHGKGSHLKQVFGKCVQTLHRDETVLLLNSPILIQCVALLTTDT